VHPKAKYKPTAPHPALGLHAAVEYATYSVETVEESVDLLLEILTASVETPRPAVETWANDTRSPVEHLLRSRAE